MISEAHKPMKYRHRAAIASGKNHNLMDHPWLLWANWSVVLILCIQAFAVGCAMFAIVACAEMAVVALGVGR